MTVNLFPSATQSTATDERYTPQWVFDGIGLRFDTDPASPVDGGDCVPAATKYTTNDDGLRAPWSGLVWLNPPFSNTTPWADRFVEHGNGVFLGPVANSAWFGRLTKASTYLWLCRDFAFTHPTHAGRRSSMPLFFAAIGNQATDGLLRLARSERHDGTLVQVAS